MDAIVENAILPNWLKLYLPFILDEDYAEIKFIYSRWRKVYQCSPHTRQELFKPIRRNKPLDNKTILQLYLIKLTQSIPWSDLCAFIKDVKYETFESSIQSLFEKTIKYCKQDFFGSPPKFLNIEPIFRRSNSTTKIGSYLATENITEDMLMKKTELQSFVENRQNEIKITNGILVDFNYHHMKNNIPFTKIHQLVNILTRNFLTQHNVGCDQLRFQIKTAVKVRKEVLHLNRDAFMNVENKLFANKDKNILSPRQENCASESETVAVSGHESIRNADIQEKLSHNEEIDTGPLNCLDQGSTDSSRRKKIQIQSPTFNKGVSHRDPTSVKLTQVRWPRHKKQIAAEYQAAQQAPVNGRADKPDDSIICTSSSFSNIELTESGLSGYSSPNRNSGKTHDIHNDRSNTNDRSWPTVLSSDQNLCEQQGQEIGPEVTLISPVVIIEKMDMPSQKISSCASERMDTLKRKSDSCRTVSKTVSEIMDSSYPKGSADTFSVSEMIDDIDTTGDSESMDTPNQKRTSSGAGVSEVVDSPDLKRTSATVSAVPVIMAIPTESISSINRVSERTDTTNPQITSSTAETWNTLNPKISSSTVSETSDIQNPASTVRISEIMYSPNHKTNATEVEKWLIPMSPHIQCGNDTELHCPGPNFCNKFIKQLSSVGITETMLENRNHLKAHVDNYPQKITLTNAMVLQLNRYRIKYQKTWNAFAFWVTVLSYSQTSHYYTVGQLRQRLQKFSKMYGSLRSETSQFLNKRFLETLDSVIENPRVKKDKGNCINVAAEIHQSQHDEQHNSIQDIQKGHDALLNDVHLNSQDQVQRPIKKILGLGQLGQHHTRELRQHTQEVRHCTRELRQHTIGERQQTWEIPNNEMLNDFEDECPQSPCIANMNIPVPRLQDSVMEKCTCVTMDTRVDEQSTGMHVLTEADDSFFVSGERKLQSSTSDKNKKIAYDSTRRNSLIDGYLSYLKQKAVDIDNGETLKSTNNWCCNSYTRIHNKSAQRNVSVDTRNSENELHLGGNMFDSAPRKVTTGKKSLRFDIEQNFEFDDNTTSQENVESHDTLCDTTDSELATNEPINSPNLDTLWCRQSCVYKQKLTNSRQIMQNKMIRVLSFVENKLKFIVESSQVSRTKTIPTDTSLATVMKNSIYSTMEDIRNYRKRFLESGSDKETKSSASGKKMKLM